MSGTVRIGCWNAMYDCAFGAKVTWQGSSEDAALEIVAQQLVTIVRRWLCPLDRKTPPCGNVAGSRYTA